MVQSMVKFPVSTAVALLCLSYDICLIGIHVGFFYSFLLLLLGYYLMALCFDYSRFCVSFVISLTHGLLICSKKGETTLDRLLFICREIV